MSKNLESLSALMDSEASEFEMRRALKSCTEHRSDSDTWRRYHLVRTLIKEQKIESTVDISSRVMATIDNESNVQKTTVTSSKWSAFGSMAIAASLTLAVMLGLNSAQFDDADSYAQNGVIDRNQPSSSLVRTSLIGDASSANEEVNTLEVIRLSEGLSGQIDEHLAMLKEPATEWTVTWLPEGFTKVADRVSVDAEAMIFQNASKQLSVVVKPLSEDTPSEGAFSNHGIVAVGRIVEDTFISVVGDISLAEADHIASNVVVPVH